MLPSLKLIFSHLKMDGWNTILTFWDGLFSGAFAVSFRECIFVYIYIYFFFVIIQWYLQPTAQR